MVLVTANYMGAQLGNLVGKAWMMVADTAATDVDLKKEADEVSSEAFACVISKVRKAKARDYDVSDTGCQPGLAWTFSPSTRVCISFVYRVYRLHIVVYRVYRRTPFASPKWKPGRVVF